MESNHSNSKSIDELWETYEKLTDLLIRKVAAEKARLEERLRKIERANNLTKVNLARRPYPKVRPKYKNPHNPAETWSGRGKQPRWLKMELQAGRKLQDFVIGQ